MITYTYIRLAADDKTIIGISTLTRPVEEIPTYPDPSRLRLLTDQELTDYPSISGERHYIDSSGAIAEYSDALKAEILQPPLQYTRLDWNVNTGWFDAAPSPARNSNTIIQVVTAIETLLGDCDWTQLPDTPPAVSAAYLTYRNALRAIPDQPGYPDTITWPAAPPYGRFST